MAEPDAIVVEDLERRYGSVRAVDGLGFAVPAGSVFGILGPNGAGKTTTVEILEGYRRPDAGTVRVLGLDPWAEGQALRPRIGVMLQERGLPPGLTPAEVLRCFAAFYPDAHEPGALLARVGLDERRGVAVRRLSGGEAQRLSLACAIVGRPDLLFLDEPTAGMDPRARATTWAIVREEQARGATVVLTTHAMVEAETLCDRLAIVHRGRLAAIGTPDELTRTRVTDEIRLRVGEPFDRAALAAALGRPPGAVAEVGPGEVVVRTAATPAAVAAVTAFLARAGVLVDALEVGRRSSLEDVFLQLTAEDAP